MATFTLKAVEIQAAQWLAAGDHPDDRREWFRHPDTGEPFLGEGKAVRYYRNPYDPGERECGDCGHTMHEHGWIDVSPNGRIVCPEDFVITVAGERFPCKPDLFEVLTVSRDA